MEKNSDPSIVVMSHEQYDWLLGMASVGVSEFGRPHEMAEFLHHVGVLNPDLPQVAKPKPLINWRTVSMVERDEWIEDRVAEDEPSFQLEAFNALMIPIEKMMKEYVRSPASTDNLRAANHEVRQEVARWRDRYKDHSELQGEVYDCWIEFDGCGLNIVHTEAMGALRAGNADLCLSRRVFTQVAIKNSGQLMRQEPEDIIP